MKQFDESCNHDKVYADYILTSSPPKRSWICRRCGEHGTDVVGHYSGPSDYDQLCKFF